MPNISEYIFPQQTKVLDNEGNTIVGFYQDWKPGGDIKYNFSGTTFNQLDIPSEAWTTGNNYEQTLIETSNGLRVYVDWHITLDGADAKFHYNIHIADTSGRDITGGSYEEGGIVRGSLGNQVTTLEDYNTASGILMRNNMAVKYTIGYVNYENADVGTPAYTVSLLEPEIFFPQVNVDPEDRVPLSGEQKRSDVQGSYHVVGGSLTYASSDEGLDLVKDILADKGNGKDLFPDPTEKDPSDPGGGGSTDYKPGTKGPHGDDVGVPGLPTVSAVNTGFITMYNPSTATLRSLSSELWNPDLFDELSRLMNNPFDALIGLNMIPFSPEVGASIRIQFANYSTSVSAPAVINQFKNVKCGTCKIPENWRNFLDYTNTSVDIFLPFVGFKPLKISDVMNQELAVEYNCDVLTGQSTCFVTSSGYCLYQYPCNVAAQIPMSGSHMANLMTSISGMVGSAVMGIGTGNPALAVTGMVGSALNMNTKEIEHGGSLNGSAGQLGSLTPYIMIHKPVQSLPTNFRGLKGYPSNINGTLGSFTGYTEVQYCHLDGVSATDREKEEIDRLLKSGVIL